MCNDPECWVCKEMARLHAAKSTRADLPRAVADKDDYDLAYEIMEEMGLDFKVRNCSCGQLPCARLRPVADALAKRDSKVREQVPAPRATETGLTVEAAREQLRSMFPDVQIIIGIRDCGDETITPRNTTLEYNAQIGMNGEDFTGDSLLDLMSEIRAWAKSRREGE